MNGTSGNYTLIKRSALHHTRTEEIVAYSVYTSFILPTSSASNEKNIKMSSLKSVKESLSADLIRLHNVNNEKGKVKAMGHFKRL